MESGAFHFLLGIRQDREFHTDARGVPEHLLELDLLGMHEEGIRYLGGADFFALAAVDTGWSDVCIPDQVEHKVHG